MKTIITTRNPPLPHFPQRFHTVTSVKLRANMAVFSTPRASKKVVKCSSKNSSPAAAAASGDSDSDSDGGSLKDLLTGMVEERVEQLLNSESNRDLLEGLERASRRVELAKRELAEIENQEIEATITRDYINRLQSRASEIAECQKEVVEARAMVEEAERSLSADASAEMEGEMTNKDEERLQSLLAASISAVIGTLAELPISLTRVTGSSQLILPLAITFLSCALFGVTFRYAIRRDLDNFQLKSGTSAAFGFVKGLGMVGAGPPLEMDAGSLLSHAFDAAVYVSESLLIFLFAGAALDFCLKLSILSPFPIDRPVPRT